MGAAGDMLAAALLEIYPEPEKVLERLNNMGLTGVEFCLEPSVKCGVCGSHFRVVVNGEEEESLDVHEHSYAHTHTDENGHIYTHTHENESGHTHEGAHVHIDENGNVYTHSHEHHGLDEIEHIISHLELPDKVKENVLGVYKLIAEAEAHVHGSTPDQIHFHEVGTLDAVADVSAVCLLMHELAPEKIVASPVHVGSGNVKCAHGILPVPAPATAYLLQGIPSYGGSVQGELCTPTGAALLKYFAQEFGPQPVMMTERIGYGMGKKDFERANCVRAMIGETDGSTDQIIELACNLDDITPEEIGFATETLMNAGALDVYTVNAGMKKNRPGIILTCMCRAEQKEEMIRLIFRHTTTLGIREYTCNRYVLNRTEETVQTEYGPIRVKKSSGWGTERTKAEYEDLARIARENRVSIQKAKKAINTDI